MELEVGRGNGFFFLCYNGGVLSTFPKLAVSSGKIPHLIKAIFL